MEAILIEALKVVAPILVAYVVKLLRDTAKTTQSASEQARLLDVADMAVQAAEQYGKMQDWSNEQKEDYAVAAVVKGFPNLDRDIVRTAVHSAVTALRIAQGK